MGYLGQKQSTSSLGRPLAVPQVPWRPGQVYGKGAGSKSGKAGHEDAIKAVTMVWVMSYIGSYFGWQNQYSNYSFRKSSPFNHMEKLETQNSVQRARERKICAVPTVEVLMKCFGHVCNAMLGFSYDTMKIHFQMNRDFDVWLSMMIMMRALEPTLKVPTTFPRFLSRLDSTLCGFVIIQVVISAPAISAADFSERDERLHGHTFLVQ